jgi:hypothetical protein
MNITVSRILMACVGLAVALSATSGEAQVVYYQTYRPMVAAPVYAAPVMAPAYVANYTPAGNYAAVTAYSPPVAMAPSAIAVTSNYAPAMTAVPVTSFYAPTVAYSPVVAPVAVAPVTAYYAPAAVVAPVYRRGPLGVWRPTRTAYYIPY